MLSALFCAVWQYGVHMDVVKVHPHHIHERRALVVPMDNLDACGTAQEVDDVSQELPRLPAGQPMEVNIDRTSIHSPDPAWLPM